MRRLRRLRWRLRCGWKLRLCWCFWSWVWCHVWCILQTIHGLVYTTRIRTMPTTFRPIPRVKELLRGATASSSATAGSEIRNSGRWQGICVVIARSTVTVFAYKLRAPVSKPATASMGSSRRPWIAHVVEIHLIQTLGGIFNVIIVQLPILCVAAGF